MDNDASPDPDNVRFNVLRNALYHSARRRYFELFSRWFNFGVVLLGTGAVASFAAAAPALTGLLGFCSATLGALQLTFDPAGRANEHRTLQRDYYRLLAQIDTVIGPTAEDAARWRSEMILLTADEPPTMRAVDAKAYNDAIGATEVYPKSERLYIPLRLSVLGRWFTFDGYDFRKISERR